MEFFDDPELIDGAYAFYPTNAQGRFRVKPVWSRTMVTDSDRKLVASVLADKVPTVLARDVRGDVAAFGSGFDFANPTMPAPASLSCLGTDSAFCKQLKYDRLGRLSSLTRPAVGAVGSDCLTYDPQGNLSSYSRGCGPVACAATAPTGVVAGADGSLTVTGAPACSGSPISYVYDDFGNLVSITQQHGSTRSETRLVYDSRSELLARSTAEQRSRPGFSGMFRSADAIGRTIAIAEWPPTHGPNLVYNIYDQFDPPAECQTKFGTPAFTKGRLAFQQTPLWNVWYGYDAMGQVVSELKLARSLSDCTAQESDKMNFTAYSYGYRGRLEEIRYPFGRHVRYQYPPAGAEAGRDPARPIGIDVEVFRAGGSTYVPMVMDIAWSRDGLLLGYRALTYERPVSGLPPVISQPTFTHSVVYEYAGGVDAESPPTSCAANPSTGSDGTRRLRRIRAISDTAGLLLDQWYTWTADQVTSVDKCYRGMTTPLTEFRVPVGERGFSIGGELTASTIPAGGGLPNASRSYSYDRRGNRLHVGFGPPVPNQANGTVNTFNADRLESTVGASVNTLFAAPLAGTKDAWSYGYDLDGRVTSRAAAVDSSGEPNSVTRFVYPYSGLQTQNGGDGSVIRTVIVKDLSYNYYYDGNNRRARKQYPTGAVEDYFYNPAGALLSERSFSFDTNSHGNTVDEYIWLNGLPIASIRSLFLGDMTRAAEWDGYASPQGGVCPRRNENARCGVYWLNPDRLGRPTFAIDKNFRLAGVGEYDAFGSMNRVQLQRETPHPHAVGQNYTLASGVTREKLGTALRARARISFADAPPDVRLFGGLLLVTPSTLEVRSAGGGLLYSTLAALGRSGAFVTAWFPLDTSFDVVFRANPGTAGDGIVLSAWDYQRTDVPDSTTRTSLPYFPPLRFPGQYYDEETDLHENWNRYYDSEGARYLSPEPLLRNPREVIIAARAGETMPTYAYAFNNPIRYVDVDGLKPGDRFSGRWAKNLAAVDALRWYHQWTKNHGFERGGELCRDNATGEYFAAPAAPNARPNACSPHDIPCPPGSTTVGDYHNHPYGEGYSNDQFSDDFGGDIWGTNSDFENYREATRAVGDSYESYMSGPSGWVRKYSPATRSDRQLSGVQF